MAEMGGSAGDDTARRAFIRTIDVATEDELIGFELIPPLGLVEPPRPDEYQYLANLTKFRLRTKGLDRARGIRIDDPFPDPDQDDGRPIPTRLIERVATDMAAQLAGAETRNFLVDSGVPAQLCPDFARGGDETLYLQTVILRFLGRGAAGRRVVRSLLGRWLAEDLDIAPTPEQRDAVVVALGRTGWHMRDGTLVAGEKLRFGRASATGAPATAEAELDPEKARRVMVVYGRDDRRATAMFDFLRAIGLEPQEWGKLVRGTGSGAPYTGEVLDHALEVVQAVVVLFTPDDEARLRANFIRNDDPPAESMLQGQPRPNVLFEAGLALGRHPARTILVEIGALRGVSDLFGRHAVRLGSSGQPLHDLAERLRVAGCTVDTSGDQWLDATRFATAPPGPGLTQEDEVSLDRPSDKPTPALGDDGLARLVNEIMDAVIGSPVSRDVITLVTQRLRTASSVLDSSTLFGDLPGRQIDHAVRKRIVYELHTNGVLDRNPEGQGWVRGSKFG